MNKRNIFLKLVFSVFVILLCTSCGFISTNKEQFIGVEEMLAQRNFAGAIAQIEAAKEEFYQEKEKVLYYLDLGMLCHYNGEYERSNKLLTEAEYAIEDLFTKSVGKAALSLFLNDNVKDYAGEDYEDIYLNIFKALNYLHLKKWDDAIVEINRIAIKLNLLEDKYKKMADKYNSSDENDDNLKLSMKPADNTFHNSALARYMSLLMYRFEGLYDDARIDHDEIVMAFNNQSHIYNFPPPSIKSHIEYTEKARINFICFTGRGPDKVAKAIRIHTEANMVFIVPSKENEDFKEEISGFAAIPFPGVKGGYHFKFELPFMEQQGSDIDKIRIRIVNEQEYEVEKIESMENVAIETFAIKKPLIYAKTIIRTLLKGILAQKGKENMGGGWGALIGGIVLDVAVDASEQADLRIARFFPAYSYISEVQVEPGIYDIQIEYYSQGMLVFTDKKQQVDIQAGKLNLFESYSLN